MTPCQQTEQFVCGWLADIDKEPVKEFKTPWTMTSLAVREMYRKNAMKISPSKRQAIVKEKTQIQPKLYCEGTEVPITEEFEMLELE